MYPKKYSVLPHGLMGHRKVVIGITTSKVQSEYNNCCVSLVPITTIGVKPEETFERILGQSLQMLKEYLGLKPKKAFRKNTWVKPKEDFLKEYLEKSSKAQRILSGTCKCLEYQGVGACEDFKKEIIP